MFACPSRIRIPMVAKYNSYVPSSNLFKLQLSNSIYIEGEFQCSWKNCARIKKGVNPFPNLARLLKHVRDIHILKGNGRIIHPDMRSKYVLLLYNNMV